MRAVFVGLLALAVTLPAAGQIAQPRPTSPIAYVSVQKIMSESLDAKAITKQIEDSRRAKTEEISSKEQALKATRLALANAGGLFRASRRSELQAQEKRQQTELQQALQQGQTDLQQQGRDAQEKLRRELVTAVDTLSKRRGIQLVLNLDSAVVWASTGTDLTADVLNTLNAAAEQKTAGAPSTR